jgi:hypothetical protein
MHSSIASIMIAYFKGLQDVARIEQQQMHTGYVYTTHTMSASSTVLIMINTQQTSTA